jgi:DNA-binding transcriptional ArsR family regulator
MNLAEQVKKSEVFAELSEKDREAILQALEAGNEEVTAEVMGILEQEGAINELFNKSIEELTEHTSTTVRKRVEGLERIQKIAEREIADRALDRAQAEHDLEVLEVADLSQRKTNINQKNK